MTKKLKLLSTDELVYDEKLYPRINEDWVTIARYKNAMKSGAEFPPIIVVKRKNDNKYVVIDGRHRIEATRGLKEKHIQAEVVSGMNAKQLYELAVKSNITHGKQFSTQEVTKIVITLKDFKYDLKDISKIVRLPIEDIEPFIAKRVIHITDNSGINKLIAIKSPLKYMAGQTFTDVQFKQNQQEHFSSRSQIQVLEQVIMLIKNDWINKFNPQIREKIIKLKELINKLDLEDKKKK